uniref:Uncharacterized protein n=1 Tax=viral metagenome TaxID=1070528 RepID=A0A6C0LHV7_9ZZZZ
MDTVYDNINKWKIGLEILYMDILSYRQNIDNVMEYESSTEIKKELKELDKKFKNIYKIEPKSFSFDTTENIFTNISKLNDFSESLKRYIEIITNDVNLKEIKSSMSDTYYKGVLASKKKLEKNKLENINMLKKIVEIIVENVSNDTILNTRIKDFETIFLTNISPMSLILFNKYVKVYKKGSSENVKMIESFLQKIFDYVLGYKNEKLNESMFSNHPILMMGLTFNLNPHNSFIPVKDINKSNSILIDNHIKTSTSYTIYNLDKLLNGDYNQVKKIASINRNSVMSSRTIDNTFVEFKSKSKGIEMKESGKTTTIYESLDGNKSYRKLGSEMEYKDVEYINKGPKPRVYLYNEECMNIIKAKEDIKLKIDIQKTDTSVELDKSYNKVNDLSSMYSKLNDSKSKKISDEERIFNIYRANTYLNEIRKLNKKEDSEAIKIAFDIPLVVNLF